METGVLVRDENGRFAVSRVPGDVIVCDHEIDSSNEGEIIVGSTNDECMVAKDGSIVLYRIVDKSGETFKDSQI